MYNNKISNYNYTNCTRIYYNNTNRIMSSELNQSTYNLSQYFYLLNQHIQFSLIATAVRAILIPESCGYSARPVNGTTFFYTPRTRP